MTSQQKFEPWTGRSETSDELIGATPLLAMAATLDQAHTAADVGSALPPLWHWLYFLPRHQHSALGADGHAMRGGFLPPVPLPRRMWAGSQLDFQAPIRVGDQVRRVSTINSIRQKDGRSGPLVFVSVRHELFCNGAAEPALSELHDIVYRGAPGANEPAPTPLPAPLEAAWQRALQPDDVLLFRYSALTFNAHRIHYDRRYVTEVEGYPGLVVHGPLIATLLLDLLHRHLPQATLAQFSFKALRPCFDGQALRLNGQPSADGRSVQLWAQDADGWLCMDALATLR